MLTLKKAKSQAKMLTSLHGEPWLVFLVPSGAPCNHGPAALFNEGRWQVCRESERADYEAGGATFPTLPN